MDLVSVIPVRRAVTSLVALFITGAGIAGAQPMTRCASCHFANISTVPAPAYLAEWQRSAHARQGVGCDRCHGGDPWTYEPLAAHRGVATPVSPDSPLSSTNVVRTCAQCHQPIATSFSTSVHQTVAAAEARRALTCTSCHSAMGAHTPSIDGLEGRCAACHPAGSPRADYAALLGDAIERVDVERARADEMAAAIDRIDDRSRRAELAIALRDARGVLSEAVAGAHAFDVQRVTERVAEARRRLNVIAAQAGR